MRALIVRGSGKRRALRLAWPLSPVLLVILAACATSDQTVAGRLTRTDSMGVTIVNNSVPGEELAPLFSVDPESRFQLGAEDGVDEFLFSDVRSVVQLDDGRIAVANGTPPEIRIFSPTGEFLEREGRSGRGPGEFRHLTGLLAGSGDTLLAIEGGYPNFQLMRFDLRTGYIDMVALSRDSVVRTLDTLRVVAGIREFLRNGSVVLTVDDVRASRAEQPPMGELYRLSFPMIWMSADYERSFLLASIGQIQQMAIEVDGEPWPLVPPNSRRPRSAVEGRGSRFCIAPNDGPEVHCVDEDGAHLVIRWPQEEVATTEADIEARWEGLREAAQRPDFPLRPQQVERMIEQAIIPPTRPPVDEVLVDAERRILVAGPDLDADVEGWKPFRVFSANGELLGTADLPPVAVHDIGDDYILGVWRNDVGVEFVVRYDIRQ